MHLPCVLWPKQGQFYLYFIRLQLRKLQADNTGIELSNLMKPRYPLRKEGQLIK